MKQELTQLIQQSLDSLIAQDLLPADISPAIQIDRTRDKSHGDLASNIALTLAKSASMKPRDLAEKICAALPPAEFLAGTEVAGPGFINFTLSQDSSQAVIGKVLEQGPGLWPVRGGSRPPGAGRVRLSQPHRAAARGPRARRGGGRQYLQALERHRLGCDQ